MNEPYVLASAVQYRKERAYKRRLVQARNRGDLGIYPSIKKLPIPVGLLVYVISDGTAFHKIGRTNNFEKRLPQLQVGNPRKLFLVAFQPCTTERYAKLVEKRLHNTFCSDRLFGEWFWCDSLTIYDAIRKVGIAVRCIAPPVDICVGHETKGATDGRQLD